MTWRAVLVLSLIAPAFLSGCRTQNAAQPAEVDDESESEGLDAEPPASREADAGDSSEQDASAGAADELSVEEQLALETMHAVHDAEDPRLSRPLLHDHELER